MALTRNDFETMLKAQEDLNVKYTGENWRANVDIEQFRLAFLTEVAEFLESSPEDWKWWKADKNDRQNQYIEVIDVLHFGLSIILKHKSVEDVMKYYENSILLDALKNSENCRLYEIINDFFYDEHPITLFAIIHKLCMLPEKPLDINKVFEKYFEKNKLNQHRIENGYMKGEYQKINENGEEDNRKIKIEE